MKSFYFKIKNRDTGAQWRQNIDFMSIILKKIKWSGEVFVQHLNGHHEAFKGQFIKWTIYGEMPIGLKSHQDS